MVFDKQGVFSAIAHYIELQGVRHIVRGHDGLVQSTPIRRQINVGYLASNLRWPLALDDQLLTVTFVFNSGRRLAKKVSCGRSSGEGR